MLKWNGCLRLLREKKINIQFRSAEGKENQKNQSKMADTNSKERDRFELNSSDDDDDEWWFKKLCLI